MGDARKEWDVRCETLDVRRERDEAAILRTEPFDQAHGEILRTESSDCDNAQMDAPLADY
jgi:hypothetical protein